MSISVHSIDLRVINLRTRMPFRYGIATVTALPHLVMRLGMSIGTRGGTSLSCGLAADHLPPKWFTKNPATSAAEDIAEMIGVIESAGRIALREGQGDTVFDAWQRVYAGQRAWGDAQGYPPLLSGFGSSLVERAMIDAFCRATGQPFAAAVRDGALGIRLADHYAELAGCQPRDLLPADPLPALAVRHTVGLSDPLADGDIAAEDRLADGLPQSLEACIRACGLRLFKIKLCGDPARDVDRLRAIARTLDRWAPPDFAYTLDGNEMYRSVETLQEFWRSFSADPALASFAPRMIFLEQPLHRDVALSAGAGRAFSAWHGLPPIIIDESDGALDTLATAVERGYAGASHKNCKGVFKGIANACLVEHRNRQGVGRRLVMSAEDLSNIGPVALPQDLAVIATLGIPHAERNGHHYFAGLSQFPGSIQAAVLAQHPDLYQPGGHGFAALDIRQGRLNLGSVTRAPFGLAPELDVSAFLPLSEWRPAMLEL